MSVPFPAKRFLASVVQKGSLEEYLNFGPIAHLFKNAEKDEFAAFDKHVKQYAAIPTPETFAALTGQHIDKTLEPPSYYLGILRNRHFETVLTKSVESANDLVQADKAEDAALKLVADLLPELMRRNGNKLIDFAKVGHDMVLADYYKKMKQGDEYGIKIGYPIVDDYGGLISGDMLSWVGRPQTGKSFLGLYGAHHVWKHQKKPPAFLSMEMDNLISAQRLVAMDSAVPLSSIKLQQGQGLSTAQLQKIVEAGHVAKASDIPFHLMDGNLKTTVEDVYNFCRMAKPAVLFVDGAYLLKHTNPRLGRFERVAENCELLKQMIAGELGIPVVASWQFSREAAKKKKSGKQGQIDLEDIGYSDAIGQISSIVLGLLEEENVETLIRKVVTILKGRSGEVGTFMINWLFQPKLDFSMFVPETESEMQFL